MPDEPNLVVVGHFQDLVHLGRQVIFAHLVEAEIPKFIIFDVRVILDMLPAVPRSSVVAHPHIVALIYQLEGQRIALLEHPVF